VLGWFYGENKVRAVRTRRIEVHFYYVSVSAGQDYRPTQTGNYELHWIVLVIYIYRRLFGPLNVVTYVGCLTCYTYVVCRTESPANRKYAALMFGTRPGM